MNKINISKCYFAWYSSSSIQKMQNIESIIIDREIREIIVSQITPRVNFQDQMLLR